MHLFPERFKGLKQKGDNYREALAEHYQMETKASPSKKSKRRSVKDSPQLYEQVKDDVASRVSTVCAENIQQLQFLTHYGKDNVFHPFMITFDELVARPDQVKNNTCIRDKMKATFLVRKGTPREELATSLKRLSELILNNEGEGEDWEYADDVEDFFQSIYPGKTFKPQGKNKQKKPKP